MYIYLLSFRVFSHIGHYRVLSPEFPVLYIRSLFYIYNSVPMSIPSSQFIPTPLMWCEVTQLCPTLGDHVDCSLPGSSVHGILQARILEWVAISFSRRSSQPRDWTQVSCIVDRRFTVWATRKVPLVTINLFSSTSVTIHLFCKSIHFYFKKIIYLFLAVLGLHSCVGFSLVAESGGCCFIVVASLVVEHGLWGIWASVVAACRPSSTAPGL